MSEIINFERLYIVFLLILIYAIISLYSEKENELVQIKKDCVKRGFAYYDCDDKGKVIFKFKEVEK